MKVKKIKINDNVSRTFHKIIFTAKKRSPEVLIGAGVVGVVASSVLACKFTTKAHTIIEEMEAEMAEIKKAAEIADPEKYPEETIKKDTVIAYTHAGFKFVKLYAPAVILGTLSLTAIIASHSIMKKRNLALGAAYATVSKGFQEYRDRVVSRFGEQLDRELKYNVQNKEFEKVVINDKGKEKVVKEKVDVTDPNEYSDYARFFDDGCIGWTKDPEHNLTFLKMQQNYANDKLKSKGYLFLNDVYGMLGIPKTKAGQIVGWLYDEKNPTGDNFVDFGLYDANRPVVRDFVNGYERTILLDFNVDGDILNLSGREVLDR